MGTSRSSEGDEWLGDLSIYSGRRDPRWRVPAELGRRLELLFDRLPQWTGKRPHPPPLGYRGCRLTAPDGRMWTAYHELVTVDVDDRRDSERHFERSLIASAPPGLLPPILP